MTRPLGTTGTGAGVAVIGARFVLLAPFAVTPSTN